MPAFPFQAEAGPHLPTTEGWKAELAWVAVYINVPHRELNPDMVTHPSTNRPRRRLTSSIETNARPPLSEAGIVFLLSICLSVRLCVCLSVCLSLKY